MNFEWLVFLLLVGFSVYAFYKAKQKRRRAFIESYQFNSAISQKVKEHYPHLTDAQLHLVIDGLRDYFYICNKAGRKMVSMPSQVVDVAWHEFILFTREYKRFCSKSFGRFLHHTPTEVMRSRTLAQDGIKRAWRLACDRSRVDPSNPKRLPLLFSIDSRLGIEDGFNYSLNCIEKPSSKKGDSYCASHIGCASGCSGDSGGKSESGGFFSGFFDSNDSSGCGGGCGGE